MEKHQKSTSTLMETGPQVEDPRSTEEGNELHEIRFASILNLSLVASDSYLGKGILFLGISLVLLIMLIIFRLKFREE